MKTLSSYKQFAKHTLLEADESDKYTHIGYGKYKEKGKEDDKDAQTFQKDDGGKFSPMGDKKGGEEVPDSQKLSGAGDFERGGEEKPTGDDEKIDINSSEFKEKTVDDLEKAKEMMAKKEPKGSDAWYPGVNELIKKLRSGDELFVGDEDEYGELARSNESHTDAMEAQGILVMMDPEKYKPIFDPEGEHDDEWEKVAQKYGGEQGRTGTEESVIEINGIKYAPVVSEEDDKHSFSEMFKKIGRR